MALFDRIYKLVIGRVGENTGFEITDLKITFNIQKTLSRSPNKNNVKVWNLSPQTRAELEKPDTRCILYAGYSEDSGLLLLFQGNVMFAYTSFEDANVITEFELGDGEIEYRNSTVSLGYAEGTSSRQILIDTAKQMGLPISIADDASDFVYPNGFSYHGAARNALTKATKAAGLTWSIQNGFVQIMQSGGSTSRQAVVLSADSGMIGSPERERQSAAEVARVRDLPTGQNRNIVSAARQYDGWRVKSLLMPTINAGDQIKLESRTADATYVVAEVQHIGDSIDGDWQSIFKLVDSATAAQIREAEAKRKAAEAKAATKRNAATPTPASARTPTSTGSPR